MTSISATAPLRTDRHRAAACLASDPLALLGDEVGVELRRGPTIRQHVAVELGAAETSGDTTRWTLCWEPVGHARALPAFAGTLELSEHDGTTTLQVTGAYRPPLGLVGIIVDGAIGHRVAEASIEHFAAAVARRLDRAAARRDVRSWRGPDRAPDLRPT